jgi:hypothetical protein
LDLTGCKLGSELIQKIEPTRPIDQIRVSDRIGGAREQIPEADLIAHICGHDHQRRVKETGDLLEQIAEECVLGGMPSRSVPSADF